MIWGQLGALFCFLSVAAGAFGSHGLRNRLTPEMLQVFEIGARYQMYHGLALLFVAWISTRSQSNALITTTGSLFTAGILIFSGSLYLLAMTGQKWWGAITPIGGTCFLAAWVFLFLTIKR